MAKIKKIFPNYKPRSKKFYRLRDTSNANFKQRAKENRAYAESVHLPKWAKEKIDKLNKNYSKSGKEFNVRRAYNMYRNNPETLRQAFDDAEAYSQGLITQKQIDDTETYINERNDLTIDEKKELIDELRACKTQEDFDQLKKNISSEKGVHLDEFNIDIG